ncbi:uncharacterized protein G2W53_018183 [Senna tora]|uniref:Uncharacterized protein n=1 Tax=Senna tora TaxID=362788 RepID=A0A834TSI9_9FABA|nr:uncharacterized protein G2W53_018183 [Senna tora]
MSSMSRALVKRKSSEETQPTGSRVTKVKLFDGPEAKARFETTFKERNCSPAREIKLDFFYKEEFRCFERALPKPERNGRRVVLNRDFLSEVLQVPNHGLCPDLVGDIITETYSKDQVVMPRFNKANDLNNAKLFIMWCLSRYLKVNLPHIILSHIKYICQSSHELAYGMVITRIAKFIKANFSQYEGEEASFQSKFDIGLLHQMQFIKIGKHWFKKWKELEITPKIEEVHELPKGGKRKNIGKEEEASSHTEKDTPISEETVQKIEEKHSPLSLSIETTSQEPAPRYEPSSPKPDLAALLKDPLNEHTLFCLLQETLRSSTFTHDAQISQHQTMEDILASVNTTNELLTSIQHLLQKQITMASISAAAKVSHHPLRLPKPQIEDVD